MIIRCLVEVEKHLNIFRTRNHENESTWQLMTLFGQNSSRVLINKFSKKTK
jgi:hypothetical protein